MAAPAVEGGNEEPGSAFCEGGEELRDQRRRDRGLIRERDQEEESGRIGGRDAGLDGREHALQVVRVFDNAEA